MTGVDAVLAAGGGGASGGPWIVLAVGAAVAALLPKLRSKRAQVQRQWQRVHDDLAAANGLTAAESSLLWRLGVSAGLENPALLFVRASLFESRAQMAQVDAAIVRSIRDKLYGE